MSFNSAIQAKNRAQNYGSLFGDPVGEVADLQSRKEREEILGDARIDYYDRVGKSDAARIEALGNQAADVQSSANFGGLLGGIGDLAGTFGSAASKYGLFGFKKYE
jgi:hypothetical protein